jgi:hypothetical protein
VYNFFRLIANIYCSSTVFLKKKRIKFQKIVLDKIANYAKFFKPQKSVKKDIFHYKDVNFFNYDTCGISNYYSDMKKKVL